MSQLTTKLQNQQDEQRSKSLDVREAALAEREAILDSAEHIAEIERLEAEQAILEAQIRQRESHKSGLEQKIAEAEKAVKLAEQRRLKAEAELKSAQAAHARSVAGLDVRLSDKQAAVTELEGTLVGIETQIADRKRYLKEQEQTVNDTVADWNSQLNALKQEGDALAGEKTKLLEDIVRARQSRHDSEIEAEAEQAKVNQLELLYQEKLGDMKVDLTAAKQAVADKQQELTDLDTAIAGRLQELKTKEQANRIQAAALREQERDLHEREQTLNMKLNVLDY